MNSFIQNSIRKTRLAFMRMQHQSAIVRKCNKEKTEQSSAALELILDDIAAETNLPITEENLPIFAMFVKGILADRENAHEQPEWDGESFL